ncbi:MAG: glycosyltransferase family 4 protein [Terriglobia bacterium]
MRVLLLTDAFPPEVRSSSHLMYELAEDLQARGHQVSVVTCRPRYNLAPPGPEPSAKRVETENMNGLQVTRLATPAIHNVGHWRRGLGLLWLPVAFRRGARRLVRPDVTYVYSPPLTLGLAAHWLSQRWKIPFVLNVQDLFPQNVIDLGALRNPLLIGFFRALERFLYRRAAALALHSAGNADWVRQTGLEASKVHVIPNWVDTERHRPALTQDQNPFRRRWGLEGRFVVLFAGVMGYAQDMEAIVEAAARLADEPRVVFLLVGDGGERAGLEKRMRELRLANVRLLPFVPREEYPALVAACDLGLVTLKKTMKTPVVPSKLPTYMASARPVIASVNPESDAVELVRRAGCGLVVPPGDPGGMAAAIRQLLSHPAQSKAMGERGRRYAVEQLSRSACVEKIERLLAACVRGRPG